MEIIVLYIEKRKYMLILQYEINEKKKRKIILEEIKATKEFVKDWKIRGIKIF